MSDGSAPETTGDIIGAGSPASNPTTPEPQGTPAAPNFDDLPKWTAALTPETRTSHFEDLKGINGPEDITRMAFDLKGKLSEAIVPPGKDASQEDVNAYLTKIGVPLDKSDYKFDVPDGSGMVNVVDGLRDLAFENKIPAETASAISAFLVENEKTALAALDQQMATIREDSEKALRAEYGDKFDAKIARTNSLIKRYGGENFQGFLDETKLGNNAEFIKMMVTVSELLSDDLLDHGQSQGPRSADSYYSFPNTPGME